MLTVVHPASAPLPGDGPKYCRKCKCSANNACTCTIATAVPSVINCSWAQAGNRPLCSHCAITTNALTYVDRDEPGPAYWIDGSVAGSLKISLGPFDTTAERLEAMADLDAMAALMAAGVQDE